VQSSTHPVQLLLLEYALLHTLLIVSLAMINIAQHIIRLVQPLELLLGVRLGVAIRMELRYSGQAWMWYTGHVS